MQCDQMLEQKVAQIFQKLPKRIHTSFNFLIFKLMLIKSLKNLDNSWTKICAQDFSKMPQFGHTA